MARVHTDANRIRREVLSNTSVESSTDTTIEWGRLLLDRERWRIFTCRDSGWAASFKEGA
jgi:hypothetical protein